MHSKQYRLGTKSRKRKMKESYAVYIHIPFCDTICSYCDFCKMYYSKTMVENYLESLKKEIEANYRGEKIRTIYIGGGTPSCLTIPQLENLFSILSIFKKEETFEFTIECNPDVTEEKIKLFIQNNVNRISMGVQTGQDKYLQFLNRNHSKTQVQNTIMMIKKCGIQSINIDLMYAFPNQTLEELEGDVTFFLALNVPHISTYSLMIEPHTILGIHNIKPIEEDLDATMYEKIKSILNQNHYIHYETSNYAKKGFESRHNLTYWNNERYYGFGLGASGYIEDIRYTNTKSLQNYIKGDYRIEQESLTEKETIENAFMLGFRKIKGISISEFKKRYNIKILEMDIVKKLLKEGKLIQKKDNIYIPEKYLYISNSILVNFIDL